MVETYEQTGRSTGSEQPRGARSLGGWIWILVAVVVAGLLIWWIAAAWDNDTDEGFRTQPTENQTQPYNE